MPPSLVLPPRLEKIEHFVVLMLENRSFDHLLGYRKSVDPKSTGLRGRNPIFPIPSIQAFPRSLFPGQLPSQCPLIPDTS